MRTYDGQRAAVVGGSIGGLTAALLLRRLGFTVDVYERTPTQLDNRGGGIVLQPVTARWFEECSERSVTELCTTTRRVRYLGRDDEVLHDDRVVHSYLGGDSTAVLRSGEATPTRTAPTRIGGVR